MTIICTNLNKINLAEVSPTHSNSYMAETDQLNTLLTIQRKYSWLDEASLPILIQRTQCSLPWKAVSTYKKKSDFNTNLQGMFFDPHFGTQWRREKEEEWKWKPVYSGNKKIFYLLLISLTVWAKCCEPPSGKSVRKKAKNIKLSLRIPCTVNSVRSLHLLALPCPGGLCGWWTASSEILLSLCYNFYNFLQ